MICIRIGLISVKKTLGNIKVNVFSKHFNASELETISELNWESAAIVSRITNMVSSTFACYSLWVRACIHTYIMMCPLCYIHVFHGASHLIAECALLLIQNKALKRKVACNSIQVYLFLWVSIHEKMSFSGIKLKVSTIILWLVLYLWSTN